jgi:hypothetical protein
MVIMQQKNLKEKNPFKSFDLTKGFEENTSERGKILRIKQGYNPNSSSLGSILFALPAALLGITVTFGAVSGLIAAAFMKKATSNRKDINGEIEDKKDNTKQKDE